MNWTEQADAMLKTWTETQKTMWTSWLELARAAPGMSGMPSFSGTMPNPLDWYRDAMQAWTKAAGPTTGGVVDQLFTNQATMMRSLELLTKAWQIVLPNLEAGKPWQPDLQKFTAQWTEQVLGLPQRMLSSGQHINELFKSLGGEWASALKPIMAGLHEATLAGHMGGALMGGNSGLAKLFGMYADVEPAFTSFAELPSVGVLREQNAKITRAVDAFMDFTHAHIKYQVALAKAIDQAVQGTMDEIVQMAKEDKEIRSVRELLSLWVRTADKAFTQIFIAPEYATLQREMSATAMEFKIRAREVAELFFKAIDMPTRGELDDAYRTLYEVRKEVKALKKALKQTQAPAEHALPATPVTSKTSAPKKAAKQAEATVGNTAPGPSITS